MSVNLKQKLENAMKEQGISQSKLAQLAKVSPATLHGYLNNSRQKQSKIDVAIVKRLCEVLKLDFHEALFGVEDPYSKSTLKKEILHEIFSGDVRVTLHRIEKK